MNAVYIRSVEMTQVFNRSPEGLQLLWMEIEVIIWEEGGGKKSDYSRDHLVAEARQK